MSYHHLYLFIINNKNKQTLDYIKSTQKTESSNKDKQIVINNSNNNNNHLNYNNNHNNHNNNHYYNYNNNQNHSQNNNHNYIININNNVNFNNLYHHYNHLLNPEIKKIIKLLYYGQYESLLKYIHRYGPIYYIPNFFISNYIQLDISMYWFSTLYHLLFKYQLNTVSSFIPMFFINNQIIDFLWSIRFKAMSKAFIKILESVNGDAIPTIEYILKSKKQDVLNLNLNHSQITQLFNDSLLYGTLYTFGLVKSAYPNFNFQLSTSLILKLISYGYSKFKTIYYLYQISLLPNLFNLIGESNINRLLIIDKSNKYITTTPNSIPISNDIFILITKIIHIQNNNQ